MQPTLFDETMTPENVEEWSLEQRVEAQQEVLGVSIDAHPLELLDANIVKSLSVLDSTKILELIDEEVRLLGIQQTLQRVQGSQDESLYALEMEDLDGLVTVLISRELYRRHRQILRSHEPLLVEGKVVYEPKLGEAVLLAREVRPFVAYTASE